MSIGISEVDKLAALARLRFADREKERMSEELAEIVAYVEKLNELETDDVEATSHILNLKNVLRKDEIEDGLGPDEAVLNAPSAKNGYFSVPKVIG